MGNTAVEEVTKKSNPLSVSAAALDKLSCTVLEIYDLASDQACHTGS